MEHIGIDLGSRESQVCIRNGAGDIIEELRCRTDRLVPWLARRARARVVVETCTEAFRMATKAQQLWDWCLVKIPRAFASSASA